jgi:hypothetical protein
VDGDPVEPVPPAPIVIGTPEPGTGCDVISLTPPPPDPPPPPELLLAPPDAPPPATTIKSTAVVYACFVNVPGALNDVIVSACVPEVGIVTGPIIPPLDIA